MYVTTETVAIKSTKTALAKGKLTKKEETLDHIYS